MRSLVVGLGSQRVVRNPPLSAGNIKSFPCVLRVFVIFGSE